MRILNSNFISYEWEGSKSSNLVPLVSRPPSGPDAPGVLNPPLPRGPVTLIRPSAAPPRAPSANFAKNVGSDFPSGYDAVFRILDMSSDRRQRFGIGADRTLRIQRVGDLGSKWDSHGVFKHPMNR
eukprot:8275364-Pyramimonas_sp.AAC.1